MTIPAITPLSTPPSTTDTVNFDARADQAWNELATLVTEINATTAAIDDEKTCVLVAAAVAVAERTQAPPFGLAGLGVAQEPCTKHYFLPAHWALRKL